MGSESYPAPLQGAAKRRGNCSCVKFQTDSLYARFHFAKSALGTCCAALGRAATDDAAMSAMSHSADVATCHVDAVSRISSDRSQGSAHRCQVAESQL